MTWLTSVRELRALVDEVAEVDWRHPGWWGLVTAVAALERLPGPSDPAAGYIASNGGPRSDTFMGFPAAPRELAVHVAESVVRARAAARALCELDGSYPAQPLRVALDVRDAATRRVTADPWRILLATPLGVFTARLEPDGSGDAGLATELARACVAPPRPPSRLRQVDPSARDALGGCVALSLFEEELSTARHLHRRGWNAGGGPWLGLGFGAGLDLVTTSHTVVDGYGHAQLSARVGAALDVGAPVELLTAAARRAVGVVDLVPAPALPGAAPLGVATRVIDPVRFPELAYATAAAMERFYRRSWSADDRRRARFTPTLQVPVAPGARDDPARWRKRVAPGLLSVRMRAGRLEPLAAFRARLPGVLAREAALRGLLGRLQAAAVRAPLPADTVRRWLSAGASQSRWMPPIDVLAGRGCVSYVRFPAADAPRAPLYAVSAPALDPTASDPRGGTVLTAIVGDAGVALTASGTGLAGTAAGADRFIAAVTEELESLAVSASARDERREPG